MAGFIGASKRGECLAVSAMNRRCWKGVASRRRTCEGRSIGHIGTGGFAFVFVVDLDDFHRGTGILAVGYATGDKCTRQHRNLGCNRGLLAVD